ncbi:MAG: hypothetical protein ACRCWJ_16845 [Casimicrobium sp.]
MKPIEINETKANIGAVAFALLLSLIIAASAQARPVIPIGEARHEPRFFDAPTAARMIDDRDRRIIGRNESNNEVSTAAISAP